MLKSMTGYGVAEFESDAFSVKVEMKAVNNRYSEVNVRLPRFLYSLEDRIRKGVLQLVSRGKVDVFVTADYQAGDGVRLMVDKPLAEAYHQALADLGEIIGCEEGAVNKAQELMFLAKTADIISVREGTFDVEVVWPKVRETVQAATQALISMRLQEGENIKADFLYRADLLERILGRIEVRSPQVVEEYQEKLQQRLTELLAKNEIRLDPERILQEVAIFADRTAITEEIVRLKSHIKQFRQILEAEQPVGRKLDFLLQEFNREANTIGSKANDYALAQDVVELKAEIEKIREQVQNIE